MKRLRHRFLLSLLILAAAAPALPAEAVGKIAAKPLYRDPVYDGAADPVVVWNPQKERWWMFYTNRRANVPGLSGVAWVHGTPIGIAESADGGATWTPAGTAEITLPPELGGALPTCWAPDIRTSADGVHHMFLTTVPGVFEDWQHPRTIVHLTSTDLRKWNYESALKLASDRVIDACVYALPCGGWRMWYNNERDHKSIYYADSADLKTWTDHGKVAGVGERPGEGPFVFQWKGHTWMLVDLWKGLGVYRSDDLLHWTAQSGDLLGIPGTGPDDRVNGGHPGVVVSGDRAYLFYFTHPGRAGTISPQDKDSLELRRSSIQVVELVEKDGVLSCDRNVPTHINLLPPTPSPSDHWDATHAANPILPGYYADPSLVQYNGKYYLYATLDPWGDKTLGCWESDDFKTWTYRELNWPTKAACTSPTSNGSMVWAPSVVRGAEGKFHMYVSVGSEVWAGVANHPLGPWRDAHEGQPLIPGNYKPGYHMIDAEAFVDDDGSAYLYWGSGWQWKNGRCFAVKLKSDMVTFDGEPRDVTPGNYFEGPFMFKHGGRYYLSYSQGVTIHDTYQVHYAIGDSPLGPFTEAPNSPMLVTDHARNIVSPGHHALFNHDGQTYILYHRHSVPYIPEKAYRQTCVDEVNFTPDGLMAKVVPTHIGPALVQNREASGNLAASALASVSSELDALHNATRVLDDNYATYWTPAPGTAANWLQLDFRAAKKISRSEIRFEYAWKMHRFAIESSTDGKAWTTFADHQAKGSSGSPQIDLANAEVRYLRLTFPEGETSGVIEWAVY